MSKVAQLLNKKQGSGTVLKTTMLVEVFSRPKSPKVSRSGELWGEDHSGQLYTASQRPTSEGQKTDLLRSPALGLCGLDSVLWAVDRPFISARSLNFDVFRKVKKRLSAKNNKQEG